MALFSKKEDKPDLNPGKLPVHIAIIMDGNGRWATKRGIPRSAGHSVGAETFRTIATYCKDIGLQYLTVYAFSTENWKRSTEEVGAIMGLLEKYLYESIEKMERDRVKLKFFGDISPLSGELKQLIAQTEEISKRFEGVQVNICVNYGSRNEILRAAKDFAANCVEGRASPDGLTDDTFSSYLYSAGIPDPDLVIRPGGELRLSNFLMWQTAYSELYFTDKLWPDFTARDIDKAIAEFQRRSRRYGA